MASGSDNPYQSPSDVTSCRSNYGKAIAILSFPIAAIPTCVMLYWLSEHYLALSESPTNSYRPTIWIYGVGLSVLTAAISFPLPLVALRFGTKPDAELAMYCMYFVPVPFFVGFLGPFIVCWVTGSSFGT